MGNTINGSDMSEFKAREKAKYAGSDARAKSMDPTHPARPTYPAGKTYQAPERKPFRMRDRPIVKRIDSNE
jgi:hypothetical protein